MPVVFLIFLVLAQGRGGGMCLLITGASPGPVLCSGSRPVRATCAFPAVSYFPLFPFHSCWAAPRLQ